MQACVCQWACRVQRTTFWRISCLLSREIPIIELRFAGQSFTSSAITQPALHCVLLTTVLAHQRVFPLVRKVNSISMFHMTRVPEIHSTLEGPITDENGRDQLLWLGRDPETAVPQMFLLGAGNARSLSDSCFFVSVKEHLVYHCSQAAP